jgi:hypothetical protein
MFQAKDGKKFGNKFQGAHYDKMHGKSAEEANEAPEFEAGEQEGAAEGVDEGQDQGGAEAVVKAHGPAHTVTIKHDHEANKHHVHSSHKDGHEHLSEHGSAQEAHDHAGKLGGSMPVAEQKKPQADQAGAQSEEDGFAMPDLSGY